MVLATALAAPQLASSAPSADPRAEREKVRAERAEVAAEIDTNKASRRELDDALQVLQENLDTQEAALARAEAAVAQAEQDIADAQSAITSLTIQVRVLKKVMRERAVRAFVSPPGDDVLTVLETKDFTTAAARKFYIELRAQDDADVHHTVPVHHPPHERQHDEGHRRAHEECHVHALLAEADMIGAERIGVGEREHHGSRGRDHQAEAQIHLRLVVSAGVAGAGSASIQSRTACASS